MKNMKLKLLASLTAVAFIFGGCGSIQKMKDSASEVGITVSPSPLEVHGGQVEISGDVKFPPKYFNKKAIVEATPVIKYDSGETAYEATTVQGESVEANNKVISFEGGSYNYSGSVPYEEGMLESVLEVRMVGKMGDQSIPFEPIKVADGVIATSTLVDKDGQVILIGDKFERITPETYEADIHYQINRSTVRNSELKAEDIKAFQTAIEGANANERKEFKGISISAYASPDGEFDLNENLAEDRKESSERYLKNELKNEKVEIPEDEEFFSLLSTAEDWDGFKELMEKSDIQDKELILRVLSMYSDPAVREREIKNITEAFEEIKEEILPQLRRAKLAVNVDVVGYSDEELRDLAKSNPDSLKLEEILYSATLFDDNNDKLAIYKKAFANFPQCLRAANAIGYTYFQMGNMGEAKAAFEKARAIKDIEIVKNNLGAVALHEGNIEEAENLISSALGAGAAANYNMGVIKTIQGDYAAAKSYYGGTPSYNAALNQLLNAETDAALSTLGKVEDNAMVFYLRAVAGARAQRQEVVLSNLRSAINADASLKDHAKKDLEFRAYRDNETFTSIVE